jgi:hypothetical protein
MGNNHDSFKLILLFVLIICVVGQKDDFYANECPTGCVCTEPNIVS